MNLPLLGGALVLTAALSAAGGWKFGSGHYKARYERLVAANWEAKASGEESARKAVESQRDALQAAVENNSGVIHELQIENQSIVADSAAIRAQLRRVRATPARSCPSSDPVHPPDSRQAADAGSSLGSDEQLTELLTNAITECRTNSATYQALVDQIKPQL